MAINKFQRSMMTFDLSAKVANIKVPSVYKNIGFSESTWAIELNFHMETCYDKLAKICRNWPPHPYMVTTLFNLLL